MHEKSSQMRAFQRIRPLIFQIAPADQIPACASAGIGTMSSIQRAARHAGPSTGCRGFPGPVPPPLWMSVQFNCNGGHGSISTFICQVGKGERRPLQGLDFRGFLHKRASRFSQIPTSRRHLDARPKPRKSGVNRQCNNPGPKSRAIAFVIRATAGSEESRFPRHGRRFLVADATRNDKFRLGWIQMRLP
jgi:hypothetical protein